MVSTADAALSSLMYQKLAVGIATLIISLIFGLLPFHLSRTNDTTPHDEDDETSKNECCSTITTSANATIEDPTMPPKWLSLATSFGGGVFLGAAMLHLLPEACEVLDDDFPHANLLCCIGFLLVLGLEELMSALSNFNTDESNILSLALVAGLSFHSLFDGLAIGSTTSTNQMKAVSIAILAHKPISAFALGSILVCQRLAATQLHVDKLEEVEPQDHDRRHKMKRRLSSSRRSMVHYYFKYVHDACEDSKPSSTKNECVCNDLLQQDEVGYINSELEKKNTPSDGFGYGSCQADSIAEPKSNDVPITIIAYIILFSTTSLLGTIIGTLGLQYIEKSQVVSQHDNNNSSLGASVAATCQSLAAGSFLYAATMEALVKERGEHHKHHYHHNESDVGYHRKMIGTSRVGAGMAGVMSMAFVKSLES